MLAKAKANDPGRLPAEVADALRFDQLERLIGNERLLPSLSNPRAKLRQPFHRALEIPLLQLTIPASAQALDMILLGIRHLQINPRLHRHPLPFYSLNKAIIRKPNVKNKTIDNMCFITYDKFKKEKVWCAYGELHS